MNPDDLKIARYYKPLNDSFNNIPIIIYPAKGDNDLTKAFSQNKKGSIEKYVLNVLSSDQSFCKDADIILVIVWNQDSNPNCDIWKVNANSLSDDSGFLYDVRIYENLTATSSLGVASGDTLTVLAAEEILLRELILGKGLSFDEASDRSKFQVKMPTANNPTQEFYSV